MVGGKAKHNPPALPTNASYSLGNGTRVNDGPASATHLHKRSPLNWNTRKAESGPLRLSLKNHFVAMVGEFVGTSLFMIFALGGTNVANIPTTSVTGDTSGDGQDGTTVATANTSSLLYISLSFGFSLAVNAWIFFRVSGGLFNPAVSLGMMLVGALTPLRAALLVFSQILGGIVGSAIIQAILPGTLNVRTQLGGGTTIVQGLFIEMFLTAMLMITILLLAAEKHKATYLAPIGIGLALFIAEMTGVYYTGGSLNPARSFGPAVVLRTFSGYHWIYWVGPALGAALAAGFYKFIKYLEYETVLGPEADEDNKAAAGAPGAPTMTGATVGTAPNMLGGGTDRRGSLLGNIGGGGGNFANQGPGIGDLLTHGDPANTFDLDANARDNTNRLDRIEALLAQLAGATQNQNYTQGGDNYRTRDSLATLREPGEVEAGYGSKGKGGSSREHSGSDEGGRSAGVGGYAYPNRDVTGAPAGETTIAGQPQYGAPLGRPAV